MIKQIKVGYTLYEAKVIWMNIDLYIYKCLKPLGFLIISFYVLGLQGQLRSNSIIENYPPGVYKGSYQNWSCTQDSLGIIYVANDLGVLLYDGHSWDIIHMPNESRVTVVQYIAGKVYVGGYNEFGYIQRDSVGNLHYKSLRKRLQNENLGFIDQIVYSSSAVYFVSKMQIFEWANHRIRTIHLMDVCQNACVFDNTLLVFLQKGGLFRYSENGLFVSHMSTTKFDHLRDVFMLPYNQDSLLIISRDSLIIVSDEKKSSLPLAFTFPDQIGFACKLKDNQMALVSEEEGVYILNSNFQLNQILDVKSGLLTSECNSVFEDDRGQLWVSMSVGLATVKRKEGISFWGEETGFNGQVFDYDEFNDFQFVGTSNGLYVSFQQDTLRNQFQFRELGGFSETVRHLYSSPYGMVVCLTNTNYLIHKKGFSQYLNTFSVNDLIYDSKSHSIIMVGENGFLRVKINQSNLLLSNSTWNEKEHILKGKNLLSIQKQSTGTLLALDFDGMVYKIRFNEKKKEFELIGQYFSQTVDREDIYKTNAGFLINTSEGTKIIDEEGAHNFELSSTINEPGLVVDEIYPAADHTFVFTYHSGKSEGIGYYNQKSNKLKTWIRDGLGRIVECKPINNGESVLVVTDLGLMALYPGLTFAEPIPKIHLKSLAIVQDTVVKRHVISNIESPISVPSVKHSLEIEYYSSHFGAGSDNQYSYKLGHDNSWSTWSNQNKLRLSNLKEGKYSLFVRTRNQNKIFSRALEIKLHVIPVWYRTGWAYFGYFILIVLLLYLAILVYSKRLKNINANLQRIIDERTAEITLQKEELEEKSKDITESIEYARTIQEAMLTSKEYLKSILHDVFILYRPKDIIGGDFYWAYQTTDGRQIIAVGDCTGHGVPGALMSMIGNSLLNELIIENKLTDPQEILSKLREGIVNSFAKKKSSEEIIQYDGMDIALVCLNQKDMKVTFAGANHFIFLIQNGELKQYNGDSQSIGNFDGFMEDFHNQEIKVQSGDRLYLLTDGYLDQFGGEKGKKFKPNRFRKLILENYTKPMQMQKQVLTDTLKDWMNGQDQVDDICVLGFVIT